MPAKAKPKKVILPKVMSKLIDIAIDDLEKVEKDKCYVVNMSDWHSPEIGQFGDDGHCSVCFAGSVMAMSLGVCMIKTRAPEHDELRGNAQQLLAINDLREGDIDDAASRLRITKRDKEKFAEKFGEDRDYDGLLKRSVVAYEHDPKKFKLQMRKLADDLRKVGL